jgi:hypothetical protein
MKNTPKQGTFRWNRIFLKLVLLIVYLLDTPRVFNIQFTYG